MISPLFWRENLPDSEPPTTFNVHCPRLYEMAFDIFLSRRLGEHVNVVPNHNLIAKLKRLSAIAKRHTAAIHQIGVSHHFLPSMNQ